MRTPNLDIGKCPQCAHAKWFDGAIPLIFTEDEKWLNWAWNEAYEASRAMKTVEKRNCDLIYFFTCFCIIGNMIFHD